MITAEAISAPVIPAEILILRSTNALPGACCRHNTIHALQFRLMLSDAVPHLSRKDAHDTRRTSSSSQRDWQPRIINARTLCARGRQKGWCKPENMCKHQILRSKSQHQILRSKSQEYRIDRCSSRCEPDFALVLCSARWLPPVSFSRCLTLAALLHTTPCAVRTTGA